MRSLPLPFLRARLAALYTLSLGAVVGSMLAWTPGALAHPVRGALPGLGLAAAAVLGVLIQDRLSGVLERTARGRIRFVIGSAYAMTLALILSGLMDGSAGAGVLIFQVLQGGALLGAGLGRGHLGTLVNALVLTGFSVLAGGPGAVVAVAVYGGGLTAFLAADFAARRLSEYPVEELPSVWPVLREGLAGSAGMVLALLGFCLWIPPLPYEPLQRSGTLPSLPAGGLRDLYLDLLTITALGAGGFWLALRWGLGGGLSRAEEDAEVVASRSLEEPSAPASPPRPVEEVGGLRGRVIRIYLELCEALARTGLRRRRTWTPREFAARLEPAEAADRLTELFARARWGPSELAPGDVEAARAAADAVRAARN